MSDIAEFDRCRETHNSTGDGWYTIWDNSTVIFGMYIRTFSVFVEPLGTTLRKGRYVCRWVERKTQNVSTTNPQQVSSTPCLFFMATVAASNGDP